MNNRRIPKLSINEKMIQGIHWEINPSKTGGCGSMKGCVMMSIDFAPPGGLVDEEIRTIKDYVVQDPTNDYYAIGLETTALVNKDTEEKARHMHIRLVKSEPTTVAKQKLVFHPFLVEGRCVWKDDNKMKRCYSLKIAACDKKYRTTCTPIKQMAYAMKESMGEYNNGITHWSNLLEDYDGSAQWCEDKAILDATVNKSKMKKEQRGEYNITVESQNSMAKKYAQLNGLEWSMDNHLEILATMLTDMTGPNAYYLSGDIRLPVKVRKRLGRLKGSDNYKEEYLKALQADAETSGITATKRFKEESRVLVAENEALNERLGLMEENMAEQVSYVNRLQENNLRQNQKNDKLQILINKLKESLQKRDEEFAHKLKESLQKRDEELAQAVMEQMNPHPMIKDGRWITFPPSGGLPINHNVCLKNYEYMKQAIVDQWRKKPHFKLVGYNDAKPWVVPTASAKRPLDTGYISLREQERSKRLKAIAKRVGYVPGELLG